VIETAGSLIYVVVACEKGRKKGMKIAGEINGEYQAFLKDIGAEKTGETEEGSKMGDEK
jgi:hypothetical protein